MKTALVMPSWRVTDIYPARLAASMELFWQPTGLLYIGARLREEGHEVSLVDGSFMAHAALVDRVRDLRPGFVGIYANTPIWDKAVRTVEDLKGLDPAPFVGVGGPMPMVWGERCFEDAPSLDAVFRGEGEYSVPEVVAALERGSPLAEIPGLIVRDGNGTPLRTPSRPMVSDLDALPFPAWDLLGDIRRYRATPGTYRQEPVGSVFSSRGCEKRCIFCFQYGPKKIRYRRAECVVEEIQALVKGHRVREIRFLDDNFSGERDRAFRICEGISRLPYGLTWYASDRVDTIDEELCRAMRRAGCWAILLGAESGVQKCLDALKKGITVAQIRSAVRAAKRAGLKVYTPFIFGIPGETFDDGLRTISFACEIDPYYVNFHTITPYPGTALYKNASRYGTLSEKLEDFTFEHASFVPHTMTRDELLRLRSMAFRRFYMRPRYIARRLLGIRSVSEIKAAFKGGRSLFWLFMRGDAAIPQDAPESGDP